MIRYVDTNILVRLMTNDIPALTEEAITQINRSRPGELIIIDAVLVELFFVLEENRHYKFTREKIDIIFEGILAIPQFKISETAKAAYKLFIRNSKLDFTDCLIAVLGKSKKDSVITFDGDLLKVLA